MLGHALYAFIKTRTVLVFATERKNNVDPRLRSQKKVKNVQLFFAKLQLGHSDLVLKNWLKDILNSHMQPQCSSKLTYQRGFAKSGQRSSFQCAPK